jgi:hypothetical protein
VTGGISPTGVVRSATAHPVGRVAAALATSSPGRFITGFLHLLIAYIIFRIAIGSGGDADQTGALRTKPDSTDELVDFRGVGMRKVPSELG